MSRTQNVNSSNHNDSSQDNSRTEQSYIDLKEQGKKVLRKLIPSQSIIMLKKLVHGADTLRREILPGQKLLPALTIKNMQNELGDRSSNQQSNFQ